MRVSDRKNAMNGDDEGIWSRFYSVIQNGKEDISMIAFHYEVDKHFIWIWLAWTPDSSQ